MFVYIKKNLTTLLLLSSSFLHSSILDLLQITPSIEAIDYLENKKQFQLHGLITEQRHPKTNNLSFLLQNNTVNGLEALFSVDEDISKQCLEGYDIKLLEQASQAVTDAILSGYKIYVYGCGATGRLAKQVESCFWRPFWTQLENSPFWERLKGHFPDIGNRLIGEMTGGDRALVSSLEGLEDLQLIGKLALEDHGIHAEDVVFAITEGGETSSVIGTILAGAKQSSNEKKLYFLYNNPNEVLVGLDRSRAVLENSSITKICLFTGPQAITGSTRMQATTSETFVMGMILEEAIYKSLKKYLSEKELLSLGFKPLSLKDRLSIFPFLQESVKNTAIPLSFLTDLEASTYQNNHFTTYLAKKALIPVFIDSTERAPTFRVFPLDPINSIERKSWLQVSTPAIDAKEAWNTFLGRPFKGLLEQKYKDPFSFEIEDPFLQKAALRSLKIAGDEQQELYDFSTNWINFEEKTPKEGDLGIVVLQAKELDDLSSFNTPLKLFDEKAALAIVFSANTTDRLLEFIKKTGEIYPKALYIPLLLSDEQDPLQIREQIALKMLLNAHSTAVMGKLGRIVGNTMTNVNPSNLKLQGRATYLIQSHVNDYLNKEQNISYEEANAVLFNAIQYAAQNGKTGVYSEVALSIIRILEAHKKNGYVSWEETENLFSAYGLEQYLHTTHSL